MWPSPCTSAGCSGLSGSLLPLAQKEEKLACSTAGWTQEWHEYIKLSFTHTEHMKIKKKKTYYPLKYWPGLKSLNKPDLVVTGVAVFFMFL